MNVLRRGRRAACGWLGALMLVACGPNMAHVRPAEPVRDPLSRSLSPTWLRQQLVSAAHLLMSNFSRDGAEALLRLRLHGREVDEFFNASAVLRIQHTVSTTPSSGENRWDMFGSLRDSPLVGYCARGIRVIEPEGPEGFRRRALNVDRLLIIGGERDGVWGAWIEGLVLTAGGWRLLPTARSEAQVESPRRDHTDVQLWDCDVGEPPRRGQVL